jgi:quercetin dioxygenase-like cupin family protein
MKKRLAYLLVPLGMIALASVPAQPQGATGVKATVLKTAPVAGLPNREFILLSLEVAPGGGSGLHTHPGDEYGAVVEGTLMVKIGDKDFVPVSAGESFSAPEGTPMEVKNTSTQTVRVINVLINEKGKPRSTPHTPH